MKLTDYSSACRDYERIEKAIMYIETNFDRQPELKEISDHIGLSEFHFQRLSAIGSASAPSGSCSF